MTAYEGFMDLLPEFFQGFINTFLLVLLIVIYAVFIWKFYRFVGTRNLFHLNLNQYNTSKHPGLAKVFAVGFYLLEYVIVLPFIIFFWFSIFTIFLIFLTEEISVSTILVLSVSIIAAIRMTSYIPNYGENLAKEIAKLLPFTLLAISLVTPGFFDFERVIGQLSQIPSFFDLILNYLLFIIILEVVLRLFEFVFTILGFETGDPGKKENSKKQEES
jgi:hypothetical protein